MPKNELFLDASYLIALSAPNDQHHARARALAQRMKTAKEWGLTDCISFVVMRERNLTEALSADAHFEQAGFRALLREN